MTGETEFTVHVQAALDGDLQARCEALIDALEPYGAAGSVDLLAGTVGVTMTIDAVSVPAAEAQAATVFGRACEQIGATVTGVPAVELD